MVPILCLKGTFGSKWVTKLHWPSHKHSAHYAGSLSNSERVLNWLGRTKCTNWALYTNTNRACSVKMALAKLNSGGFLMLFPYVCMCECGQSYLHNAWQHTAEGSQWISLTSEQSHSPKSTCLFYARVVCRLATVRTH